MITVYTVCLILGGVLLGLSLLGGEIDAEMDVGGDLDFDADFDPDLDAEVHGALDGAGHGVEGQGLTAAARYLSFRDVVFFAAFFGLSGLVLRGVGIPEPGVGFSAGVFGLGASTLAHRLMVYLKRTESGAGRRPDELEGRRARVLVEVSREMRGKIVLDTGEQTLHLLAAVAEESDQDRFPHGAEVTILYFDDGTARVAEPGFGTAGHRPVRLDFTDPLDSRGALAGNAVKGPMIEPYDARSSSLSPAGP